MRGDGVLSFYGPCVGNLTAPRKYSGVISLPRKCEIMRQVLGVEA